MANIVKGIQTDKGLALYDYNSLANLPAENIIDTIYCETLTPVYEIGGIQMSTTGATNELLTRARTTPIATSDIVVSVAEGYSIWVAFWDSSENYLGFTGTTPLVGSNIQIFPLAPTGATKSIVIVRNDANTNLDLSVVANSVTIKKRPYGTAAGSNSSDGDIVDVPENQGVLNTLLKAKQLRDIKINTVAVMPQHRGDWSIGMHRGMPYSSTRPEALFVPQCVSLYTFMSAAANPNSYLYTIDLGKEYNNQNGTTYYGTVCSSLCGWSLGIKPIYATFQWPDLPGMERLDPQDPAWFKLGDTFVTNGGGHVLMITGIKRTSRGRIKTLEVTDTGATVPATATYSLEKFRQAFPPTAYTYCRYTNIHKSPYEQSPFVTVEDETPIDVPTFPPLMPRKGDKANYLESGYLTSESIEIDVLEKGAYTNVEIYKNDSLLKTLDISDVITLNTTELGYGNYKACLTDGTNRSQFCYWIIVNISTTVEDKKDGTIHVTFNSLNSGVKPVWVQWADGNNNGTKYITEIPDDAANAGEIYCKYPPEHPKTGYSFKLRVAYETEYGVIHGPLTNQITISYK